MRRLILLFVALAVLASLPGLALADDIAPQTLQVAGMQLAAADTAKAMEADPYDDGFGDEPPATIEDPFETWNRFWFAFNDLAYTEFFVPIAKKYARVVPEEGRLGIRNAFSNLLFPVRFLNCVLQGKLHDAGTELSRFVVNSTVGLAGFFDPVKSTSGVGMKDEDTGQTLAVWGAGTGPYLVWPLLGASSVRGTVGALGDMALDPLTWWVSPRLISQGLKGERTLNELSLNPGDYDAMKRMALDPYVSMRNGYIQHRTAKISE